MNLPGLATHLHATGSFGACGVSSPRTTILLTRVDCCLCRKTRDYKEQRQEQRKKLTSEKSK